ncbi:hypothetical protein BH23GEM7_BH23GEM7_27540 [soil metagenome]
MHATLWKVLPGVLIVAAAAAALRPPAEAAPLHTLPAVAAISLAADSEVARLRAHFDEVERELLARDVSHLSPEQRVARARNVQLLRDYSERGIFPHNHDFPGERLPYFVDHRGTHCAMAYLIARSGHEELVEKVRATQNHEYIAELAGDPELVVWLDGSGLTVEDAARIQPAYDWRPPAGEESGVSARHAMGSALVSGFGGAAIALNLTNSRVDTPQRWPGVFGITAGALGMALGATMLGDGGDAAVLGGLNAGIGLASVGLGVRTLLLVPADRTEPEPAASHSRSGAWVSASPLVSTTGDGAAGVMLTVRF